MQVKMEKVGARRKLETGNIGQISQDSKRQKLNEAQGPMLIEPAASADVRKFPVI
jgi:hypothetical protein